VLSNMNIIFAFIAFYFSSDLQFKFELSEEIQLNELNLMDIANTLRNVPKAQNEHVGTNTVGTHTTKTLGAKR
jgi:hypothetical protein